MLCQCFGRGRNFKKYLSIFLFIVLMNFLNQVYASQSDLSMQYGLMPGAISSARTLLNNTFVSWKKLSKYNAIDLAKRLNYFVYNFCETPNETSPAVTPVNELFKRCVTACGGRSYVLRGLLAVYGIHSDYANLYNIPIQGNHTMVQIKNAKSQALLDPTFGVFFVRQPNVAATPLSLQGVRYYLSGQRVLDHVFSANKTKNYLNALSLSLHQLYTYKRFKTKLMMLSSYIEPEAAETSQARKILFLTANFNLKNGFASLGDFNAKTVDDGVQTFLRETNETYSSHDYTRYISYDISYLGYLGRQMILNTFMYHKLKPGKIYQLSLLINNPTGKAQTLNIGGKGRQIVVSPDSQTLSLRPGLNRYKLKLVARSSKGALVMYPIPGVVWTAQLLAIQLKAVDL